MIVSVAITRVASHSSWRAVQFPYNSRYIASARTVRVRISFPLRSDAPAVLGEHGSTVRAVGILNASSLLARGVPLWNVWTSELAAVFSGPSVAARGRGRP